MGLNGLNHIRVTKNSDRLKVLEDSIVYEFSLPNKCIIDAPYCYKPWPITLRDVRLQEKLSCVLQKFIGENGLIYCKFNGNMQVLSFLKYILLKI